MADRVFARLAGSAPPVPSGPTITSYGVTWTFSADVTWGTFLTGDPWVIGPATVIAISPGWANDGGGAFTNGSIKNPQAYNQNAVPNDPLKFYSQGYSQRYAYYVDNMNVANKLPQTLQPGDVLSSSVGYPYPVPNHYDIVGDSFTGGFALNNVIKEHAVLTVLADPPPANAFRPAWTGEDKRIFTLSQVNASLLPALAPTAGTTQYPRPPRGTQVAGATGAATYAMFFKRPWMHLATRDYLGSGTGGADQSILYYAFVHAAMTDALYMLMSNQPKQELMINMIQQGIDHYGVMLSCNAQGVVANRNVGSREASRFPALLAGTLLQDTTMQTAQHWAFPNNGNGGYREDFQTYSGTGWTGATALWRFKPIAEHEHVSPAFWETVATPFNPSTGANCACYTESYRRENGGGGRWAGYAMFIHKLGLQAAWNHNVFLDYVDRWYDEGDPGASQVHSNCDAVPNSLGCPVHQRYLVDPNSAADPNRTTNCFCVTVNPAGGFQNTWQQNMWNTYRDW